MAEIVASIAVLAVLSTALAWWWSQRRIRSAFVHLVDTADLAAAPERIHLQRDDRIRWNSPRLLRALAGELSQLGFQRLGSFRVPEIPDAQLAAAVHPGDGTAVVVYEHARRGIWCEAISELADGESIAVSNARPADDLEHRPEEVKISLPKARLGAVVERLREQIDGRPVVVLDAGNFVFEFEEAYARDLAWQKSKIDTAAEVTQAGDPVAGTAPDAEAQPGTSHA